MKASRKKPPSTVASDASSPFQSSLTSPSLTPILSAGLIALVVAVVVAMPLVVSEGAIAFGTQVPTAMLIFILVIGWSLLGLQRTGSLQPVDPSPVRPSFIAWSAAALIAWHTLSGLVHLTSSNGRSVLNATWLWLSLGAVAWLIGRIITSTRQVRGLMAVMIAVGVVLASHAGYQYLVSFPALRAQFAADRQEMLAGSEQQYLPGTPEYELLKNRVQSPEPLATFALTNSLAGFLAPWLVVAAMVSLQMGVGLWSKQHRNWLDFVRLAGGILVVVALVAVLLLTHSRTGVLAAICGCVLFVLLTYSPHGAVRNRMIAAGVGAAVLGLAAIFGFSALDPANWLGVHASVLYRLEYWHSTLQLLGNFPIFGCGPGNFQDYYPQFKLPQASETVADPHNFLMEVAATAGIPGLMLLLIVLGSIGWIIGPNCSREIGEQAPENSNSPPSRDVWPIYAGACGGLLFAWPFGLLVGYPAENLGSSGLPVFLVLGLPLLLATLATLHEWVLHGTWTLGDMGIIFATLFLNLLAAGSTSFPGVIVTAWICGALVAREESRISTEAEPTTQRDTFVPWLALGAGCLLAAACYFTAYRPVLQSRVRVEEGQALHLLGRVAQAEAAYRAAAAEDPWSPVPWQNLAVLQLQLRQSVERASFDAALAEATDEMLARSPHSSNSWLQVGNWKLLAYRFTGRDSFLEEAVRAYEIAAGFYPNGAFLHAQLAWVHHLRRDDPAAQHEAQLALQLDSTHSHAERKLAARRLEDVGAEFTKTAEPLPELSALEIMHKLQAQETTNNAKEIQDR